MDNITHTLSGLVVARAGLDRLGPGSTLAVALASNVPDLDIVTGVHGTVEYLAHHRGVTHGLAGSVALAVAVAVIVRLCIRGSALGRLFLASLAGTALHIVMDLWTSYGTRALLPFDSTWYAWDLVFIVDPWILGTLVLALFLFGARSSWRRPAALAAIAVLTGYIGARAVLHHRAVSIARATLAEVHRLSALPDPLSPFRWRVVADGGDAFIVGRIDLLTGRTAFDRRAKTAESLAVAIARQHSRVGKIFLDYSPYAALDVRDRDGGTEVSWRDLRFERGRRERFIARVLVSPDGKIVSESFHY